MVSGGDTLAVRPEQQSELYNSIIGHRRESAFHDHFDCYVSDKESHPFSSIDSCETFQQTCFLREEEQPRLPEKLEVRTPPITWWGSGKNSERIKHMRGFMYSNRFSVCPTSPSTRASEYSPRFEMAEHEMDFVWTGVVVLYGSQRLVSVHDYELNGNLRDGGSFTVWVVKDGHVVGADLYFLDGDEPIKETRSFRVGAVEKCLDGGACEFLTDPSTRVSVEQVGREKIEQIFNPVEMVYRTALRTAGLIK